MRRVPRRITVGDTVYTVRLVRNLHDGEDPAYGMCFSQTCEIHICSGMPPERVRSTLVHEVAHAVFEESGFSNELILCVGRDKADAIEEDCVRRVIPQLLHSLRLARIVR